MEAYVEIWPSLGAKFRGIPPVWTMFLIEIIGAYLRYRFHGGKPKGYGDTTPWISAENESETSCGNSPNL